MPYRDPATDVLLLYALYHPSPRRKTERRALMVSHGITGDVCRALLTEHDRAGEQACECARCAVARAALADLEP